MTAPKKTIAIVCDKNPHTSFGRMTLDLRDVLSGEFDVCIIWLTTPKYFSGGFEPPNGSHTIHAPSLEAGWLTFRRPLRNHLKKIMPNDVLLIRPELGFLVDEIHKALPGARALVFVHDMFSETLYPNSIKFKLINRFFINPMRNADGFICNSKYTQDIAGKVMGLAPNLPVIGCPIDTSAFHPHNQSEKARLKQKWGLDGYRGVCLNISLNEPRKNIATYFALAKQRPDVAFVRVGPCSKKMSEYIAENKITNIIHYLNIPQEQLLELYGCANLFIYPSLLEGFGMPPLEALACGVAVAAASTSALKENLEGVVPLIDPPDCVEGYLKVIDDVLDGKSVVDKDAAKKLLDRFSIECFGERARACFRSDAK
ncbi:MAG: glycosyltransferase [Chitinispirillia bacterium]|nr:glycosyltransferase [Chitinispirillia bacterium]MCL2267893.1 glycosyltransferase [Chitinispirillia bacterium]